MTMSETIKRGLAAGEPGARESFVKRYQDEVYTWFLMDDPETAEFKAGAFFKTLLEERPPAENLTVWVFSRLLAGGGGPFHALHTDLKTALFLRDVAGLSEELTAEILKIPVSTMRIRLHRARQTWRGAQ